jgi:hypothetical protein
MSCWAGAVRWNRGCVASRLSANRRGVAFHSKVDLAVAEIEQFEPISGTHTHVLIDSWYHCQRVRKAAQKRTWDVSGGLKKNRKMRLIAAEASGRSYIESDEAGASLTFAFRGHSVDLVARKGPNEGHLLATLDGRNVTGLPTDELGRSYLDLNASVTMWQARLSIASGLATGQHVVRLAVSDREEGECNVDALEVSAGQPPAFPTLTVAGLSLGLLAVAAAIVWELRTRPRREKFF